jgi:uncharacterized protein (TIGR02145 family)
VWVWIDLSPITGTSPGTFEKAKISEATATAGSITTVSGNTRGFYVTASPSTVTATLDYAPADKFNWCVYGSDAPPNVTAANGTYTLYGTPPFTLIAANGTATQTVEATAIATSAVTITPVTLTDQTGCPGVFCIYTGSDLYIDGTHLCQQRTSGARNWEAHIKDSRDDQIYRIVQMPTNIWWMAQNLNYNYSGTQCGKNEPDYCAKYGRMWNRPKGLNTDVCPSGWRVPAWTDIMQYFPNNSDVNKMKSTTTWTGNAGQNTGPGDDYYGASILATGFRDGGHRNVTDYHYEGLGTILAIIEGIGAVTVGYGGSWGYMWSNDDDWVYIRCIQ